MLTLQDLLSAVDLGQFLLEESITLLANRHDGLAGSAKLGDGAEHLLGDLGGILVLGESIRVVQGVVCIVSSISIPYKATNASECFNVLARKTSSPRWPSRLLVRGRGNPCDPPDMYIPISSFCSDMIAAYGTEFGRALRGDC